MNNIKLIIVFIICNLFINLLTAKADNNIIKLEVKYISWNSTILDATLDINFLFQKKVPFIHSKNINSEKDFDYFEQLMLIKNEPVKIGNCDDIRICCLITRKSGKIDTIAFGKCFVMYFNGTLFQFNLDLFLFLVNATEQKDIKEINEFIYEVKVFYKGN